MRYPRYPILAGLVLVSALALAGCKHDLNQNEKNTADVGGLKFSQAAGADFISCSGLDSDGDGYTSCSAKDKATGKVVSLVCSYENAAGGCKYK